MNTEVKVILNVFKEKNYQLYCNKDDEWKQNPCIDGSCSDLCAMLPNSLSQGQTNYTENLISCRSINKTGKGECEEPNNNHVRLYKCRCAPSEREFNLFDLSQYYKCVCLTYKIKDAIVETRCDLSQYANLLEMSDNYECSVYDQLKQEELSLIKCEYTEKKKSLESTIPEPLCLPVIYDIKLDPTQTFYPLNYLNTDISGNYTSINSQNLQYHIKAFIVAAYALQNQVSFYVFLFLLFFAFGTIFTRALHVTYDTSSGRKRKRKQRAAIKKALKNILPKSTYQNPTSNSNRTSGALPLQKNNKLNLSILGKNKELLHTSLF